MLKLETCKFAHQFYNPRMSENSANLEATGKPTPAAGCTIFLVILGMVAFLAIFATYQYKQYKAEIINISQKTQKEIQVSPTDKPQEIDALVKKMDTFAAAVKDDKKAEVSFSVDEINLAIAHYPKLENFRKELHIKEITSEAIVADISFPVRAGFDGIRYLNGTMKMDPVIAQGSIFPIVTEVKPDTGNPVPPKFTKEFPTFLFTEYRNDEKLADVFHKLSKVELQPGKMVIISDPDIKQPDALPEDVTYETNRAFWVFGLLVFMFVTTVAFLLWVKRRKQNASE
ncbi:hypothetical protein SAMN02745181_1569 [Rubritalea squalenifaciens DSM 18772]|uniref:Uncharacterized protein n=2 Tax=Rubritalea squalenifaciens TaxID=407226 RepID=A0A1M6HU23_9BACT|nr:hypothetical protein SAMN02745181_1569 [Rubritalea squalenifaciens DSM 18772]